jgi:hypothetical protein
MCCASAGLRNQRPHRAYADGDCLPKPEQRARSRASPENLVHVRLKSLNSTGSTFYTCALPHLPAITTTPNILGSTWSAAPEVASAGQVSPPFTENHERGKSHCCHQTRDSHDIGLLVADLCMHTCTVWIHVHAHQAAASTAQRNNDSVGRAKLARHRCALQARVPSHRCVRRPSSCPPTHPPTQHNRSDVSSSETEHARSAVQPS